MSTGASPPPDWYPDPDEPGQERYWNGTTWSEQRRPSYGGATPPPPPPGPPPGRESGWSTPPPPPSAPPGYVAFNPALAGGGTFAQKSNAGWALAAAIVGLLCCGPLSIVGIVIGRNEMAAIDSGAGDPSKRGLAQAAFVIGIIGVIAWAVLLVVRISSG